MLFQLRDKGAQFIRMRVLNGIGRNPQTQPAEWCKRIDFIFRKILGYTEEEQEVTLGIKVGALSSYRTSEIKMAGEIEVGWFKEANRSGTGNRERYHPSSLLRQAVERGDNRGQLLALYQNTTFFKIV
jgi:hypothetical protein